MSIVFTLAAAAASLTLLAGAAAGASSQPEGESQSEQQRSSRSVQSETGEQRGSFALVDPTQSDILTREVEYQDGGTTLRGYFARPAASAGSEAGSEEYPVVVIVHAWRGHNEYVRRRAEMLAQMGYAAFALDMYGKTVKVESGEEARELSSQFYDDRNLLRQRFKAGYDAALRQDGTDDRRTAAIGYCFGGTVVLEMVRTGSRVGVELDAATSFHGGLNFKDEPEDVTATVLVCNGYDDPLVEPEDREEFQQEMAEAGADFIFVNYADAVHAFTEPEAGERGKGPTAYNAEADLRSWKHMTDLFEEKLRPSAAAYQPSQPE